MIKKILTTVSLLSAIIVTSQKVYIPKPLNSHEPIIYSNKTLGYSQNAKRIIIIDSASNVIFTYGFNRDGLQTYYTKKGRTYNDSMANIYSNGNLIRNEVYDDKILLDYRTYDYKNGKLVLFCEFSDKKLFTKTSYTYKNEKLIKAYTKMPGIKYYEKYDYYDDGYSIQRKKIGKRNFEIINEIKTQKFKSVEIYDPEDLDFRYEKQTFIYNDEGLLTEYVDYELNREFEKLVYYYDGSCIKHIKTYRYGNLNSETFLNDYGHPLKIIYYYSNTVHEYENTYNDNGDRVEVKFFNDGKLITVTKFVIEYW